METYLSIEGLAKYLGITEQGVRKWVLNREIPFHKIKKIIRFRLSEIEQWIDTCGKFPVVNENDIVDEGDLFVDENSETDVAYEKVLEAADEEVRKENDGH